MATTSLLPSHENITAEDDYIDMDISSDTFLCHTKCSPPHSKEFEFHMSPNPPHRETNPSPADELFYKGKLLPLHLPPRLQMVESLLRDSDTNPDADKDRIKDNAADTATATSTASAPSSCYVSRELNPEEYLRECSSSLLESHKKKTWSEKLKSMRKSTFGLKCIRSLFAKCDESGTVARAKACSNACPGAEKNPNTLVKSIERERLVEEECVHRKSFSGAINWLSSAKSSPAISSCSSSSSSFSSVSSGTLMLKRSSSVNSEAESAIEGAIAHCKKSQVQPARRSLSDVRYTSLAASKIAAVCENKERPGICRG